MFEKDDIIALGGYRGDHQARVVRVVKVRPEVGTIVAQDLIRSSPGKPVYRQYRVNLIQGWLPVKTEV
jgi:hypothetical protein